MDEAVCSFCLETGYSSEVLSLERLEFDDWHGWPSSVTEVVGAILPEVTNPTDICKDCLQTVLKCSQLKRDISMRAQIEDAASELGKIEVKDECGEFNFAQSFTDENIASPEEFIPAQPFSDVARNGDLETVAVKQENEDELLSQPGEPMELEAAGRNMHNDFSSTSNSDLQAAAEEAQLTVLPNTEVQMLKEMAGKSRKRGLVCSFCSKPHSDRRQLIWHLLSQHSVNKELFKTWLKRQMKKSLYFSSKSNPKCCVCRKRSRKLSTFQHHLLAHIIQGEVEDAEFFSMKMADPLSSLVDAAKKRKRKSHHLSDKDNEFVKAQCLASKLGSNNYQCVLCSLSFSSYGSLHYHIVKTHLESEDKFFSWIQQKIDKIPESSRNTRKWPCCVCPKVVSTVWTLRAHYKKHFARGEIEFDS